jgi:hypothetical protein
MPPEDNGRPDRFTPADVSWSLDSDYSPSPTYDPDRWEEKEQSVPLESHWPQYKLRAKTILYALRHFDLRIAPDCEALDDWEALDRRSQRLYRTALLKELLSFTDWGYRELENILSTGGAIARELGFEPDDGTDHSTLATGINNLDINEEFLERAAEHSYNAGLHAVLPHSKPYDRLSPHPSKPQSYYEIAGEDREVDMATKMERTSSIVAEYMSLVAPELRLDRDTSAGNFKYPVEEIYRLLAHIALEDCAAKNGSELLAWLSDDDVPSDSTLHEYISPTGDDAPSYEVEEIEAMFIRASCELLERIGLAPSAPVHLAYDITTVPWYGSDHEWVTGTLPEDNTNEFWHYAVLSTVSPGRNYVLGATPIKERSEKAEALNRMLRQVRTQLDLDLGRIFLDRQMYQGDIVRVCREHDLEWLIQAPKKGAAKTLVTETPLSTPTVSEPGVEFSNFDYSHEQVNLFAVSVHEDEVGYDDRVTTPATELTRHIDDSTTTSDSNETPEELARLGDYGIGTPELVETSEEGGSEEGGSEDEQPRGVGNPETHTAWITDLDVEEVDLEAVAYHYRSRWKIETSIRQLKHTFQGQCRSSRREVRTLYFGAAQLFFNFWVALNREVPHRLGDPVNFRLTGLETLHAIREADFDDARGRKVY